MNITLFKFLKQNLIQASQLRNLKQIFTRILDVTVTALVDVLCK